MASATTHTISDVRGLEAATMLAAPRFRKNTASESRSRGPKMVASRFCR